MFKRAAVLTTCFLILISHTAKCQTGVPETSSNPYWNARQFSPVAQGEKDNLPQTPPQSLRMLLTAKTVLVVEPSVLYATNKAVQTLKKALVKWGRFQLVDNAETADLVIVISEYSSSKPTRAERVIEGLAIFMGGNMSRLDPTPMWAVEEVGPLLGQRPTGKLVEDLRMYLAELETTVATSSAL